MSVVFLICQIVLFLGAVDINEQGIITLAGALLFGFELFKIVG